MSDAALVAVAEAVRTEYAAAYAASLISQNISVVRIYKTRPKLEDLPEWDPSQSATLGAIRVFVSPDDEDELPDERERSALMFEYSINVGIAAKPATTDPVNVDPLHYLREQLKDFFFREGATLNGRQEGATGIETITDMDRESLRDKGLFLAEFQLIFTGRRPQ